MDFSKTEPVCRILGSSDRVQYSNNQFIGRFHTRGRTNCLDGLIVSDGQIVWCENGTNKFFDEQIVWYLAVWKDVFSQTIFPSRRTSQRQYDINLHQTDKCQTICSSSSVKTAIIAFLKRLAGSSQIINFEGYASLSMTVGKTKKNPGKLTEEWTQWRYSGYWNASSVCSRHELSRQASTQNIDHVKSLKYLSGNSHKNV